MATHQAAVNVALAQPFKVQTLHTPKPGPGEVLVTVKAIAINPVDYKQREFGFNIDEYPAVLGSDIAGYVTELGSHIPADTPFRIGSRVIGFAKAFFCGAKPCYGAFQEKVILPVAYVAPIPEDLSFVNAATMPMSVMTAWSGWYTLGLPYDTRVEPAGSKAVLVWGAASSVGMSAVQSAHAMGFKVFAVASIKHKALLESLGAFSVTDYSDPEVVSKVISAARDSGVTMKLAYQAMGDLHPMAEIMKAFGGGCIAHAPPPKESDPKIAGVELSYLHPPADEPKQTEHIKFAIQTWLASRLADHTFIVASKPRVIPGGLDAINTGCAILAKGGISGEKLVVEL